MADNSAENSESFYEAALARIPRFMISLALVLGVATWLRFGWRIATGFSVGCGIAYLNFYWLERVIATLADRVTRTAKTQSTRGVVLRFLLRYFLMAIAAYAIFSVSPASLYGLFAGLFLPIAGIACEAAYELYAAYARGF